MYSQDGLYIPPHLPQFTGGYKYVNRKQYVNSTDAQFFGLYPSVNEQAILEILYSDHYSPADKSPVNCPPGCRIQTYLHCLLDVMKELHTKHDNLVHTYTHYMPRTRDKVFTPSQLRQFVEAHNEISVNEYQLHDFV